MMMCRYCASEIPEAALVCRYCGRSQPGTVWAQWSVESPMKWITMVVAFISSAAFGMGVLSLLAIRSLMISGPLPLGFGDALAPPPSLRSGDFDVVIERRREWRDGDSAPVLDRSSAQPLALDRPREVEVSQDEAQQFIWNVFVGTTYTIAADGTGGFDPYLYLFRVGDDDTLSLLNSNDDGGAGVNALISQALTPGEYVVVVESFSGRGGRYEVRVTQEREDE